MEVNSLSGVIYLLFLLVCLVSMYAPEEPNAGNERVMIYLIVTAFAAMLVVITVSLLITLKYTFR